MSRPSIGFGMVGLGWWMTWMLGHAQVVLPEMHPWPSGVQGVLYGDDAPTGRPAPVVSIQRLADFQNRLFVALTDAAGHEILDVWDTRQVSRPLLVSSLDFGSVLTNGVMFTPLTLVPFADGLLLQTRAGLALYRFDGDGRLVWDRNLPPTVTGLGLDLTQIHVAGRHGSLLQQVIPNPRISGQHLDRIHREVLLDLANPKRPKLLWTEFQGPTVTHTDPINSVFGGHPASLAFDPGTHRVRLVAFEAGRASQQDVFWAPKIRSLFSADALDRSLRDLLAETLRSVPLGALQAEGVRLYAAGSGPGATSLSARILEHQGETRPVREVLDLYGIALEDPLELAIAKAAGAHLDSELEARLGAAWYAAPMQAWLRTLLGPGVPLRTAAETKAAVSRVFNSEIDEQTLARYLTLHVISPLIGSPEFMTMTLDELLDDLVDSTVGRMIDGMLRSAGGYGALNSLLDGLDDLLGWLFGNAIPSLPECARFPDSAEQLIHLAMFSWNDAGRGVTLDRQGLAWFELLKFYRYLTGRTDFAGYTAEINQRLRGMQEALGDNLAGRLSQAFELPGGLSDLPALHARLGGERQSRLLIGRMLARALIGALPVDAGFEATMTTRAALIRLGLHVREPGIRESTVADLLGSLQIHGVADLRLDELYQRAADGPLDLFASHVEQVLRLHVQASFHASDLDRSLMELLRPFLDFDVGVQDVMGDWMGGLLNELLGEGPGMSGLMLNSRQAFENHDCIASWLVTLKAIALATAWAGGDVVALALEFALSEGYQAGVSHLVNSMFGTLIREVMGGYGGNEPAWLAAQLEPRAWDWIVLDPIPGSAMTVLGMFAWQERVVGVVQERSEANWFGPRQLKLVVCHPDDPYGTRQVYDLGRWQTVNVVNHHQGAVLVGGTYFAPGDGALPSGKALVVAVDAAEPRVQHLKGEAHLPLGSAPLLAGANHGANLAIGGLNRVYLLPNPVGAVPAESEPGRPPQILRSPMSAEVPVGGAHEFSVRISGTAPVTCQWLKEGAPVADGNRTRLRVVVADVGAAGEYSVVVSNALGTATARATLSVQPTTAFRFVQQPRDLAKLAGQDAILTVGVESAVAPRFQWFHGGRPMEGETNSRLVMTNLAMTDAGDYLVEARQGAALLRSRVARLGIVESGEPLLLKAPSARQPLGLGTSGGLSVTAVGWGDLTYAWSKNSESIPGAVGSVLSLGDVTEASQGSYRVEVRDAGGRSAAHSFTVVLAAAARMSARLSGTGRFEVILSDGVAGQSYSLLRSTDLTHWTVVRAGVFRDSEAESYEEDVSVSVAPAGYFRLRVTP